MRYIPLIFASLLLLATPAHADAPATEFFVIETPKLALLAPTDAALDALSSAQLTGLSLARGVYQDGLSLRFATATFRIDARFTASVGSKSTGPNPESIGYRISASHDPTTWSLVSETGSATRQGGQYLTEDWRTKPVTVLLRYMNLKH